MKLGIQVAIGACLVLTVLGKKAYSPPETKKLPFAVKLSRALQPPLAEPSRTKMIYVDAANFRQQPVVEPDVQQQVVETGSSKQVAYVGRSLLIEEVQSLPVLEVDPAHRFSHSIVFGFGSATARSGHALN